MYLLLLRVLFFTTRAVGNHDPAQVLSMEIYVMFYKRTYVQERSLFSPFDQHRSTFLSILFERVASSLHVLVPMRNRTWDTDTPIIIRILAPCPCPSRKDFVTASRFMSAPAIPWPGPVVAQLSQAKKCFSICIDAETLSH